MKSRWIDFYVGLFVIIGMMSVAFLSVKMGKMNFFPRKEYILHASFLSISGLKNGAEVQISGIPVGKVTAVHLEQSSGMAEVKMRINQGILIDEDSIASIKTSGLIGDKYIQISPGGSDTVLENGDRITETESAVDLEDLIRKFVFGSVKE